MKDLLSRIYNFYAPVLLVLWLTFTGHWIWLLGAIGVLLLVISNNLYALMKVAAEGVDEVLRRMAAVGSRPDMGDQSSVSRGAGSR